LVMASALRGSGVIATFRLLLDRLYTEVDAEFELAARHGIDRNRFIPRLSASDEVDLA